MLFLESLGEQLTLLVRVLIDCSLLMICLFPTLYFLVFKEMTEQVRLRQDAELTQSAWNQNLELMIEERTERIQKANEDLLVEVQQRARAEMALRAALNEARRGKDQLNAILNAVDDALLVIDAEWRVLAVNRAAEAMFNVSSYDLQGNSLKGFLRPWVQSPSELERVFSEGHPEEILFLETTDSAASASSPMQMCAGADLEWDGRPAKVVTFRCRRDRTDKVLQSISEC